jgi:hypothetical protein
MERRVGGFGGFPKEGHISSPLVIQYLPTYYLITRSLKYGYILDKGEGAMCDDDRAFAALKVTNGGGAFSYLFVLFLYIHHSLFSFEFVYLSRFTS